MPREHASAEEQITSSAKKRGAVRRFAFVPARQLDRFESRPMSTEKPTVAILLATKDGERFLSDQLKSFAGQAYAHWKLIVSDDGSSDSTLQIIEAFRPSVSNAISVRPGPRKGYSGNFMSLALDPTIVSDYYAFCDQDDIWECDKLDRALAYLTTMPDDKPALCFARTELIDDSNSRTTGKSPLFTRPPSFANALVQNIGGGNTMVFNAAAKRLLELTSEPVVSHDWWTCQVVTAADGCVKHDAKTSVKYRGTTPM